MKSAFKKKEKEKQKLIIANLKKHTKKTLRKKRKKPL